MGTSQSRRMPSRVSLMKSGIASSAQHEVERRRLALGAVPHAQDELPLEDGIARVGGFAWEVQLGRQHRALRRLHLEMKVARPPGIDAGHDRLQAIAALVVGELVTPQAIAG